MGIRDSGAGPDSVTNPLVRSWADSWWHLLAILNVDWQRPRFSPISPPWPLPIICKWLTFTVQSGHSRSPHSVVLRAADVDEGLTPSPDYEARNPLEQGDSPKVPLQYGASCVPDSVLQTSQSRSLSHKSSVHGHHLQEKMSYGQNTYCPSLPSKYPRPDFLICQDVFFFHFTRGSLLWPSWSPQHMVKAGFLQVLFTDPHSTPLAPVPWSKQREHS